MKRVPPGVLPLIAVDRRLTTPLYRQIYEGYRTAILDHRLRGSQRVPSTRTLAAELRISRIPVLNAFEQLLAEGYFEARVGAGTFVARSMPGDLARRAEAPATAAVPSRSARRGLTRRATGREPTNVAPWLGGWGAFRVSEPAIDRFPLPLWSRMVARHTRNATYAVLQYGDPRGHHAFREAIAAYLRTSRAVRCEAEQILVVSGSQQALEITARVLVGSGSRVWIEDPGYAGARDALNMAGARLVAVPVDEEGLDVARGIALAPRARAAYVTPSHQYPMGVVMSASRRLRLLEWARGAKAWIIEDDYDSEYRYGSLPIAALQGLDRDDRVIYTGTFSKVLFPALRLGYIVVPPDLIASFTAVREAMDIFPPPLLQAALTDFIREGHFTRHVRRMRVLYQERRQALVCSLREELGDRLEVAGDEAGLHLVAALTDRQRDQEISVRAARQRLWVMPLSSCYLGKASRHGLVLGYGGTRSEEMPDAVRRLRNVLIAQRGGGS